MEAQSYWVFLTVHSDDQEGVLGVPTKLGLTPASTGSEFAVEQLREQMQGYANGMKAPIRLVRFDRAEVLETWEPIDEGGSEPALQVVE